MEINPASGPVNASIRPPGSKSLTNRVLPIAAIATGQSVLRGVLDSDDTQAMLTALRKLGIPIEHDVSEQVVTVEGQSGQLPVRSAELYVGNSGTTIRFLTALLGLAGGDYELDGIARMRQRPIGPLVDALRQLGVKVIAQSPGDCPPVSIHSSRAQGGHARLSGNLSSQYLSGLMLAAPLASETVTIDIEGPLISKPYVEMTAAVMRAFGVDCSISQSMDQFEIAGGQSYVGREFDIEPDASAASYFWAAAAICGGSATVQGLNRNSLQGDVGFVNCLEQMGCKIQWAEDEITVTGPATHGIDIDMADVSDTVQTLAAVAMFVTGSTTIRNIAHNRVKETDRIGNLAIELRKLGATVDEHADGLTIHPGDLRRAEIETYDDHRMAMSLALVGLKQPGVTILDPGCVSKTFPGYFAELDRFVS